MAKQKTVLTERQSDVLRALRDMEAAGVKRTQASVAEHLKLSDSTVWSQLRRLKVLKLVNQNTHKGKPVIGSWHITGWGARALNGNSSGS